METLKIYYALTKPGIIRGNLMTAAAGFLLASKGHIRGWSLLTSLLGISLVIASACVFNNYIDRNIDKKMARTKKRALASGTVSVRNAIIYASVLGISGFGVLAIYTNALTVWLGIIAYLVYIILYGAAKRYSVHGTIVGSIAGALPPVAGYTAAADRLDGGAILLFLILVCWQMPHFYAIAMYRLDDYAAVNLPVLPVKQGMKAAKRYILAYIVAFMVAAAAMTLYGYTGFAYLIVVLAMGIAWLWKGIRSLSTVDDVKWGRGMFFFSLLVLMLLSVMLSLDAWLP